MTAEDAAAVPAAAAAVPVAVFLVVRPLHQQDVAGTQALATEAMAHQLQQHRVAAAARRQASLPLSLPRPQQLLLLLLLGSLLHTAAVASPFVADIELHWPDVLCLLPG